MCPGQSAVSSLYGSRVRTEPTNKVLIFLEAVSSLEFSCVAKFNQTQEYWLLSVNNEDKHLEDSFCTTQAKNKNSGAAFDSLRIPSSSWEGRGWFQSPRYLPGVKRGAMLTPEGVSLESWSESGLSI